MSLLINGSNKKGGSPSPTPKLQEKQLDISENGRYDIIPDSGYDGLSKAIVEVAIATSGWQPQPDWFDIEAIFNADADPNKRQIILLSDANKTVVINNSELGADGCYYKTSDGATYSGATTYTHTWDLAQDKSCSVGYKTRYIIVYSSSRNVVCNLTKIDALYVYEDDCNITAYVGNTASSSTNASSILEAIKTTSKTTASSTALAANYAFAYCPALQSIVIPSGVTSIGAYAFNSCYALQSIVIPLGVTYISQNAFAYCSALQSLVIPSGITSMGTNPFGYCYALQVFLIIDGGIAPALYIGDSKRMSYSALIDFGNKLGIAPTSRTLTLGAVNLAKLSADEKAVFTSKNYTLA